jgi:presenilin-like A22 family membrane protease
MIDINKVKNQNVYKIVKYILMALFIFIATKYIPQKLLKINEIIIITISSTIVFVILDTISPSINVNISCDQAIKNP